MSLQVPWCVSRGQRATLEIRLSFSAVESGPQACTTLALLPEPSHWLSRCFPDELDHTLFFISNGKLKYI